MSVSKDVGADCSRRISLPLGNVINFRSGRIRLAVTGAVPSLFCFDWTNEIGRLYGQYRTRQLREQTFGRVADEHSLHAATTHRSHCQQIDIALLHEIENGDARVQESLDNVGVDC